jgi:hypothetical protein
VPVEKSAEIAHICYTNSVSTFYGSVHVNCNAELQTPRQRKEHKRETAVTYAYIVWSGPFCACANEPLGENVHMYTDFYKYKFFIFSFFQETAFVPFSV